MPLIERLAGELGALVSVDTYKPDVARAAIAAGAAIVNDVSGLHDPELADVCARDRRGAARCTRARRLQKRCLIPGFDATDRRATSASSCLSGSQSRD